MAKDRITDQTIEANFSDGDILYGADVNKIIKVFKEGINKNKIDLNRILTGSDYFYIADDFSGLTALISEQVPSDGQRGYVFNNKEAQGSLEVYIYNEETGVWDFLHNRLSLDGGGGSGDRTYVGPDEPSSNFFTKWIKTTGDEIDVEIEENSIEADFEEIETEPMLNEIETQELTGDEIITPPQFE